MDKIVSQLQLHQYFLGFFLPKGILDFFEPVWMETQSLDSRESKKDIIWLTPEGKSFTAGTRYGSPHSRRVNKKVSFTLTFLLLYLRTTGADVVQYKVIFFTLA